METETQSLFRDGEDGQTGTISYLYVPSNASMAEAESFAVNFTMFELRPLVAKLTDILAKTRYEIIGQNGKRSAMHNAILDFVRAKQPQKREYVRFLSFFIADERNFSFYLNSLPLSERKLCEFAATNVYIDGYAFHDITGEHIIDGKGFFFSTRHLPKIPALMSSEKYEDRNAGDFGTWTYCIVQYSYLLQMAKRHFLPQSVSLNTLDSLPSGERLTVTEGTDAEIATQLPIIKSLVMQNILRLNAKGQMLATVRKQCAKQLTLREFMPATSHAEQSELRTTLALQAFANYYDRHKTALKHNENPKKLYTELLAEIKGDAFTFLPSLLPHVTGLSITYTNIQRLEKTIELLYSEIAARQGWFSVDDVVRLFVVETNDLLSPVIFSMNDYAHQKLKNKITGKYIGLSRLHKEVFVPLVKGLLLLLGSIGLFDVACREHTDTDTSYTDSLTYARLTPLGAYVFNLTNEYTPAKREEKAFFELDDNNLILKSVEKDNPFESIVSSMAEEIGGGRYVVSAESFLKNCKTYKDVKDRIDIFHQFVSKDVTPVWAEFFKEVQDKCSPLTPVRNDFYTIYQISPDNKELLRILSTDETLRSLVKRAEGYLILINKDNLAKVANRLKSFGYLL